MGAIADRLLPRAPASMSRPVDLPSLPPLHHPRPFHKPLPTLPLNPFPHPSFTPPPPPHTHTNPPTHPHTNRCSCRCCTARCCLAPPAPPCLRCLWAGRGSCPTRSVWAAARRWRSTPRRPGGRGPGEGGGLGAWHLWLWGLPLHAWLCSLRQSPIMPLVHPESFINPSPPPQVCGTGPCRPQHQLGSGAGRQVPLEPDTRGQRAGVAARRGGRPVVHPQHHTGELSSSVHAGRPAVALRRAGLCPP